MSYEDIQPNATGPVEVTPFADCQKVCSWLGANEAEAVTRKILLPILPPSKRKGKY
jgi:hypothetical protein